MAGIYRQSFDDTSNAPETEILGGTDQTRIGNVGDRLKVDASVTVSSISSFNRSELSNEVSMGHAFSYYNTTLSVPASESNIIYIKNPTDSGKTVYIAAGLLASIISTSAWSEFLIYFNHCLWLNW